MYIYFTKYIYIYVLFLVIQSCPTLSDPIDCSPPRSSVHGNSPDKYGLPYSPPGDFPNQCLLHCRWILYHLSSPGKSKNCGVCSLSLL